MSESITRRSDLTKATPMMQQYLETKNIAIVHKVLNTIDKGYRMDISKYDEKNSLLIKDIYDLIAQKHKTKNVNVEKAIRDNIERTWTKTNADILECFYPYPISKESGTPTNMEFIKNISRKVRKV